MKSKVYVVQRQMHLDRNTNEFVERFDLSPAKQYGELVVLLSPTAAPWKPDRVIEELHSSLKDFTEDDFLLLIGNPVLIGLATAIASERVANINFLQWSGKEQKYMPIRARLQ